MESLFELNVAVLIFLVITFYLLAVCQSLHVSFLVLRRDVRPVWLFVLYEIALFVHLALSVVVVQSVLRGIGQPYWHIWSFSIPLESLLWINFFVFLFGAVLGIVFRRPTMAAHVLVVLFSSPPLLWVIGDFWWVVLIVDASLFLFRGIATLAYDLRRQSVSLSRISLIEALNALPEGLLYADDAGRALLMNDSMRAILIQLGLPTDLADARSLWGSLQEKAKMSTSPDSLLPEGARLSISEQEIRLFTLKEADSRKKHFQQIFAIDVTEEERLNFDIEQTNYFLEKAGNELRKSLEDLQEAAENEVLLRLRSRVHDIIGQRLSILHRYLEDGSVSEGSLEHIRILLSTILEDLVVDEYLDPSTALSAVVNAFSLVGIEFDTKGELPSDEAIAEVFVDVIREATTNAAKHGQASLVSIRMEESD